MSLKIDLTSKIINSTMQCSGERVAGVILWLHGKTGVGKNSHSILNPTFLNSRLVSDWKNSHTCLTFLISINSLYILKPHLRFLCGVEDLNTKLRELLNGEDFILRFLTSDNWDWMLNEGKTLNQGTLKRGSTAVQNSIQLGISNTVTWQQEH
jgi:hypothetical protein